ncbi:unnamed protein product [Meloidogyne enterolobii]|uniref:Uncharacterized protein n=1 Tax=Meloidogyne enterolobii TaxID=390850 RepID=A0ACB0YID4_MELEN
MFSPQPFAHSVKIFSFSCKRLSFVLYEYVIFKSSAYSDGDILGPSLVGRSFMYIVKSKGAKMVPCGTPEWVVNVFDFSSLIPTENVLFCKKFVIHLCIFPLIPYVYNFSSK